MVCISYRSVAPFNASERADGIHANAGKIVCSLSASSTLKCRIMVSKLSTSLRSRNKGGLFPVGLPVLFWRHHRSKTRKEFSLANLTTRHKAGDDKNFIPPSALTKSNICLSRSYSKKFSAIRRYL